MKVIFIEMVCAASSIIEFQLRTMYLCTYIHVVQVFLQEGSSCKLHQASAKDSKYRLGTMIKN